ncbi:DUF6884 domain-containing protein (plasmid) [Leclercia adecarboxylata]|uniref:DUF6884 domain-containing protein n=1 Tax=Leclercia adecarboxylata TaxID=83655 RepID=UPI0025B14D59|nr:DUF6884 domain-containing protein [Leclercia adecarboxylata]WJT05485.1 hypothetical protein OCT50_22760 [Leclercia adecarboxylata]
MTTRPVPSKLHLIITCTRRKTVAAGSTVFPEERDAVIAYEAWLKILEQALSKQPFMTAGDLYSGQHWQRAVNATESTGAEMWVLSAGLGLLHVSDRVVPYEATFSSMRFFHRSMWSLLTSSPPTGRRCTSLRELMHQCPHDRFIVAASPVYLKAVEEDLYAGSNELASLEQLTIVTSKGYQGCFGNNVTLTSAAMMNELNTNMTGLNISHAVKTLKMQNERRRAG